MKFTIGFEKEDTRKLHEYWDDIIEKIGRASCRERV